MRLFSPTETPYLSTLVANLEHLTIKANFKDTIDPLIKRWGGPQSSFLYLSNPERKSEGAGANPEVGREAALAPDARREFEKFIADKDQIVIQAGLGGGTGGGAIPVVAQYCLDMKKTVIATAVMPRPNEGRTLRAQQARNKLIQIVPTITINNSYIGTYLKEVLTDPLDRMTYDMDKSFQLVSKHSITPTFFILQEIMHKVGETVHSDHSDLRKILAGGKELYVSVAYISDEEAQSDELTAQKVFDHLSAGHFQNKDILQFAEIAGFWYRNWSPYLVVDELSGLARERWGGHRSDLQKEFELLEGYRLKSQEGDTDTGKWVAVIAAAKTVRPIPPTSALSSAEAQVPATLTAVDAFHPEIQVTEKAPLPLNDKLRSGRNIPIEYVIEGEIKSCGIPAELAEEYPDLENLTPEGRREINEAIQEVTMKGYPDSLVKWDRTISFADRFRKKLATGQKGK